MQLEKSDQRSRASTAPPGVLVCKWQGELVSTLTGLGARVVVILDRADRELARADPRWALCSDSFDISTFDSLEELAAVAAALQLDGVGIDHVISHQEVSQHGAGYLESLLGLRTDPLFRVTLRDKRLMKQRLADAGVPVARFASVSSIVDGRQLHAASARLNPPYVVKPVAGFGSMSTVRLGTRQDLMSIGERLRIDPQIRSKQLIVEEFVDGDELQIEMFWSGGDLVHFVVFRYHTQRISMMPLRRSARDGVRLVLAEEDPAGYEALRTICVQAGRAMGIRDGNSQIEAFYDSEGRITVSEVAGRGGGAWTPALMNQYLGYPVWDLIARCHLRTAPRPPHRPCRYLASISVRPDRPGQITALPSTEELQAQPGVLSWDVVRRVGDIARLHHPSDYYVHVILGADSLAELEERSAAAQQELQITTEGSTAIPVAARSGHDVAAAARQHRPLAVRPTPTLIKEQA